MKTKITDKKIEKFLQDLLKECKREDIYSVIKKIKEMGVDHKQVLRLTLKNKNLENLLDECNAHCYNNIETAFEVKDISFDEGWAGIQETSGRAWRHRCRISEKYRKEWIKSRREDRKIERKRIQEERERRGEEVVYRKKQIKIGLSNGKKKAGSDCKP